MRQSPWNLKSERKENFPSDMDIREYLKKEKEKIDRYLEKYLPPEGAYPSIIHKAMRYSVFAGGKRLRPILLLTAYRAVGGKKEEDVMPFACSLELIHTYSLIHDDLPAIDNDDMRRGKPTSHKVFGEAIAILAGDALFSFAFELMLKTRVPPGVLRKAMEVLTRAIGTSGIIGGQVMDIEGEKLEPDPRLLRYIHSHKTGAFISAAVEIGGILGRGKKKEIEALRKGGGYMGMAFQIVDDILDVVGDEKKVGKKTQKDASSGKITYPAVYGLDGARRRAERYTHLAINSFERLGKKGKVLVEIAKFLFERDR